MKQNENDNNNWQAVQLQPVILLSWSCQSHCLKFKVLANCEGMFTTFT